MTMTPAEVANLLSQLAAVDNFHATPSQEKFAIKTDSWWNVLKGEDYEACTRAISTHYSSPNAKSLTVGQLRSLAQSAAPRPPAPLSGAPDDVKRRERACNSPACRCTHLECYNGFLDKETTIERNGRSYPAVVRCPVCKSALEARTGVAV